MNAKQGIPRRGIARLLAVVLTLLLAVGLAPVGAFAAYDDEYHARYYVGGDTSIAVGDTVSVVISLRTDPVYDGYDYYDSGADYVDAFEGGYYLILAFDDSVLEFVEGVWGVDTSNTSRTVYAASGGWLTDDISRASVEFDYLETEARHITNPAAFITAKFTAKTDGTVNSAKLLITDGFAEETTAAVVVGGDTATHAVTISDSIVGGSVSAYPDEDVEEGETVTLTVTPDQGYRLVADSLTANAGAVTVSPCASENQYTFTMPDDDVTISAEFEAIPAVQYTVTFDPNGGSVAESAREVTENTAIGELPVPSRAGFIFEGWWTAASGGAQIDEDTVVTESVTYYAHWKDNSKWTVTFDARGGKAVAAKIITKKKAVGTLTNSTRSGYTFNGWYTKTSGGTKITAKTVPTKDVTYYAQWTAKSYKVTYDAAGGKNLSVTAKTVKYGSKYGTHATTSRTGYSFAGWHDQKSGGTKITKDTKVGTAKAHTLYAHWTAKNYTATFNANGGKVSPVDGGAKAKTTKMKVTYAKKFGKLPVPTRTGYKFAGWYTAKDDGTKITGTTAVKITKNTTYYAHWKKK